MAALQEYCNSRNWWVMGRIPGSEQPVFLVWYRVYAFPCSFRPCSTGLCTDVWEVASWLLLFLGFDKIMVALKMGLISLAVRSNSDR